MLPAGFQILTWPGSTLLQAPLCVCTDEQRGQEPDNLVPFVTVINLLLGSVLRGFQLPPGMERPQPISATERWRTSCV